MKIITTTAIGMNTVHQGDLFGSLFLFINDNGTYVIISFPLFIGHSFLK